MHAMKGLGCVCDRRSRRCEKPTSKAAVKPLSRSALFALSTSMKRTVFHGGLPIDGLAGMPRHGDERRPYNESTRFPHVRGPLAHETV
jgi:hypothetical protein